MRFFKLLFVLAIIGAVFFVIKDNQKVGREMLGYFNCGDEKIQSKVNNAYANLTDTEAGRGAVQKADDLIARGLLAESARDDTTKAFIEMALRGQYSCDVPESLTQRVTKGFAANPDGKDCDNAAFQSLAEKQYSAIKQYGSFPQMQSQVFAQISAQLGNERARELFSKKWENPRFKKKVMVAVLNVDLRDKQKCTNVALPVASIIQDLIN